VNPEDLAQLQHALAALQEDSADLLLRNLYRDALETLGEVQGVALEGAIRPDIEAIPQLREVATQRGMRTIIQARYPGGWARLTYGSWPFSGQVSRLITALSSHPAAAFYDWSFRQDILSEFQGRPRPEDFPPLARERVGNTTFEVACVRRNGGLLWHVVPSLDLEQYRTSTKWLSRRRWHTRAEAIRQAPRIAERWATLP